MTQTPCKKLKAACVFVELVEEEGCTANACVGGAGPVQEFWTTVSTSVSIFTRKGPCKKKKRKVSVWYNEERLNQLNMRLNLRPHWNLSADLLTKKNNTLHAI